MNEFLVLFAVGFTAVVIYLLHRGNLAEQLRRRSEGRHKPDMEMPSQVLLNDAFAKLRNAATPGVFDTVLVYNLFNPRQLEGLAQALRNHGLECSVAGRCIHVSWARDEGRMYD